VRRAERAFTWAILVFCAAYALDATSIDMRLGQQVSAAAFPLAAAFVTAAACITLLVSSRRRTTDGDRPADIGRTEVLVTAIGFAYWLSLPWAGYTIATSLFLLAGTSFLGERLGLRLVAVSVGTATALWIVFVFLLGVPLPGPPLGLD
jgi:Tripartite tricarboxylate transporter TctB family